MNEGCEYEIWHDTDDGEHIEALCGEPPAVTIRTASGYPHDDSFALCCKHALVPLFNKTYNGTEISSVSVY